MTSNLAIGRMPVFASIIILAFLAAAAGCSSSETSKETAPPVPSGPLALKEFGPPEVRAGQDFNIQPTGISAIWAATENATPTSVLVINGVKLKSDVQNSGKLVTAGVPREVYATPGEYPIYLQDEANGARSNELKFIVK